MYIHALSFSFFLRSVGQIKVLIDLSLVSSHQVLPFDSIYVVFSRIVVVCVDDFIAKQKSQMERLNTSQLQWTGACVVPCSGTLGSHMNISAPSSTVHNGDNNRFEQPTIAFLLPVL